MNHPELEKVEDEAADWAVLLADDPQDKEQLRQWNAWLNSSPRHRDAWRRACRVYQGLGQLTPSTQQQWPAQSPSERGRDAGQRRGVFAALFGTAEQGGCWRRWSVFALARRSPLAGLAVATCLLVVLIPHLSLRLSADYLSGTGEQQIHKLRDGSTLYLAPESAVDIDYAGGQRMVRLLKGTAFFDVQPDNDRPFIVDAGDTRTTVLGTAFNVDKTDSAAVVSVAHGLVKVEDHSMSPAVSESLTAGDRLAVTWEVGASLSRTAPDDIARWRRGELVVRNQSVSDVVAAFDDYYSGVILVSEPFASQRVTGFYRLNDPVATLTEMAHAHGATARRVTPWLLVLSE